MTVYSHFKAAVYNLWFSPVRTLLAMLGILIGTASVVALVSSGKLATEAALKQFEGLGTELMTLDFSPKSDKEFPIKPVVITNIPHYIKAINYLAPFKVANVAPSFKAQSISGSVIGTTAALQPILSIKMKQGRFISDYDNIQFFCVIGKDTAASLKVYEPMGKQIKLGSFIFTVIGIMDTWPQSTFFQQDVNSSIIVPFNVIPMISPSTPLANAVLQLKKTADVDAVKQDITSYFTQYAPAFNPSVVSAKEVIAKKAAQQNIFTLLLGLIGSIALIVGGIGVMNIMLASIAERRFEIGLRLALGAHPRDIQSMFLIESALIAAIGGIVGVLLGILATYFISFLGGWVFEIYIWPIISGFGVSMVVCVFFGFYPAYVASRLDPIQALRAT